ncbi:AAA family ATPase [Corynebacterium heidelbergense]|uniref:ATPase AAA-type core domain-containing protein n=1 Tax=Corynebacterium heidelbergense TaxID=2055947 RepID=A0A364V3V8_9CORY|nr:ATP-binding protein [Corynebacterium heidelbergense]RAV31312.1 hypothetical protein DLJ54_09050 [Corynebacterium heidelbergense]
MKILSVEASNHRSFRDDLLFELTEPSFTTAQPAAGRSWSDVTFPVAAIYGANASGKTALIRAINYIWMAVGSSSREWLNHRRVPQDPFKPEREFREKESRYRIEFTLPYDAHPKTPSDNETRFAYEFALDRAQILYESLEVYRTRRATMLIDRDVAAGVRKVGTGLGQAFQVSPRELMLSRARDLEHPVLKKVADLFLSGVDLINVGDFARDSRIGQVLNELAEGERSLKQLECLAAVADLGIRAIRLDEHKVQLPQDDPRVVISKVLRNRGGEKGKETDTPSEEDLEFLERNLLFTHGTDSSDEAKLYLQEQSSGTLSWLAAAFPIMEALQRGTVLCIDELDASLHPLLAATVVEWFQDPEVNKRGAQLIFTTHDVTLLNADFEPPLRKGQVWMVEKNRDGVSELYSLADFSELKGSNNWEKQYLRGRFGGLPRLISALGVSLIESGVQPEGVEVDG